MNYNIWGNVLFSLDIIFILHTENKKKHENISILKINFNEINGFSFKQHSYS